MLCTTTLTLQQTSISSALGCNSESLRQKPLEVFGTYKPWTPLDLLLCR